MPDHVALLVDPVASPPEEVRRFQEYYDDVVAALATQRAELDSLLETEEPADGVERLNRDYSVRLLEQRVRHLQDDVQLRTEHLHAVKSWADGLGPARRETPI